MKHFVERGHAWAILDNEKAVLIKVFPSRGDMKTSLWRRRADARKNKPYGERYSVVKVQIQYEIMP